MRRSALLIVLLVVSITIINYFDRISISFAIEPIESELLLNNTDFGLIAGAFGIGYFFTNLFAGILVDRWGSVRIWGLSALVWSLVTLSLGFASGFWSLFLLRILLGITEGFNSPSLLRTVSDWLDPLWRARFLSIGLLGVPIAAVIGSPFITLLIEKEGWRAMFIILGLLGIAWVLFWFSFFKGRKCVAPVMTRSKTPWLLFLTSRAYLLNCLNFFTFGCIVFFGFMWLPGFLQQTKGLALNQIGLYAMIPWIVSGLFQLAGGWAIDFLWKRTESIRIARIYPICFGLFCSGICFGLLSFTSSLAATLVFFSLGLGFTFFINPSIYSLNADLFPTHPATAQSLSTAFFALAGIVSPSLAGWLSVRTGNFNESIYLIALLAVIVSIVGLLTHLPKKNLN